MRSRNKFVSLLLLLAFLFVCFHLFVGEPNQSFNPFFYPLDHPRYVLANAGCKHFDAYGGPENIPQSRFSFNAQVLTIIRFISASILSSLKKVHLDKIVRF